MQSLFKYSFLTGMFFYSFSAFCLQNKRFKAQTAGPHVTMHHWGFIHSRWFQVMNVQRGENHTCLQEGDWTEQVKPTVRLSSSDLLQEGRLNRSQQEGNSGESEDPKSPRFV